MTGYAHARKVTVTECSDRALPAGYQWLKTYRARTGSPLGRDEWQVKSDAPGFAVSVEWFETLTEARKHARAVIRAGRSTWGEVYRWCEHGHSVRGILWTEYERELIIT